MVFPSVKNPLQRKSFVALLTFLASATQGPSGMGVVPKDKFDKANTAQPSYFTLVGTDPADANMVQVKATTEGIAALTAPDAEPVKAGKPQPVEYAVVELDGLPDVKRGGNKGDSYPFGSLDAPVTDPTTGKIKYKSFFVPATATRPNPAKALSSTAASAGKRYAKTDKRTFTVRKALAADGVTITGAHVIRVS
jgi:hypothetical protein